MGETAQERALKQYRSRLAERGMARFEVVGRDVDRGLIRALAKRLAENDGGAARIREAVRISLDPGAAEVGGVWAAFRQAPPEVGELDLTRSQVEPRRIDL
jgi:hypothetical protein